MADVMSLISQMLANKQSQQGLADQGAQQAMSQQGGASTMPGPKMDSGQGSNLQALIGMLGGGQSTNVGGPSSLNLAGAGQSPLAGGGQSMLNWSGGFDPSKMLTAANQVTGKNLNDPNYWQGRYNEEGGASGAYASPDYWYQKMLGKGAAGADAAPNGPYSAANGYHYTPTPQELGMAGPAAGQQGSVLSGLNFNPLIQPQKDYTQIGQGQGQMGAGAGLGQQLAAKQTQQPAQPQQPVNSAGILGKLFGGR